MKKILVLGSAGMLGHVVTSFMEQENLFEVHNSSYPQKFSKNSIILDATNIEAVRELVNEIKPDILVNCIGILIKGSSSDPSNAIFLNSYFPHQLSKIMRENNGRVIHISTDCVFSGKKGSYKENDFKDARDIYGLSKALGELNNETDLTIRTSIIGPEIKEHGEGLMHWFFNQIGEINGFDNAIWGGVTTLQLAKAIIVAINKEIKGLYHLTNNKKISKYDLLLLIKQTWNIKNVLINKVEGKKVDKSLLDTNKIPEMVVPSYAEMLIELRNFMYKNKKMYEHYQLDYEE